MKGNLVHFLSAHSLSHRLRQGSLRAAYLAALVGVPACAQSTGAPGGSETHFLKGCSQSCGAGLECIDGHCTAPCENDVVCNSLNDKATCEEQPSRVNACAVGCNDDADCTRVLPELSCTTGVCRGPLWQPNPVVDSGGGGSDAACEREPGCPESEALYFSLPEGGIGTVRLEFLFDLGQVRFERCAVEFVDDVMVDSSCESDTMPEAVLEPCTAPTACEFGRLRFDLKPDDFVLTYWQDGYQTLQLDTTTWSDEPYTVGSEGCEVSCTTPYLSRQLLSAKGDNACLNPNAECAFGLGCGDRASALENAPECGLPNTNVLAGVACDYDVLVYQQYIESSRAFYNRDTGELVGFWHRSDTQSVECSGHVPFDCADSAEVFDVCEGSDAGADEPVDADVE